MIQKILVPLDGSAFAESALPQAMAMARAYQAEVVLARVLDADGRTHAGLVDSVSWRLARTGARRYLDGLAAKLGAEGIRARTAFAEGNAAGEILRLVTKERADLVLLCSHGSSGPSSFSLGGTSQKVLSRAGTSVLVVRPVEPSAVASAEEAPKETLKETRYQRILVPLDGSQRSQWALLQVASLARAHKSELLLVHVVAPPPLAGHTPPTPEEVELACKITDRDRQHAEVYLRDLKELVAGNDHLQVRTLLLESPHVVRTLLKVAADEQVSLVVVSAHGCSGAAPWPYGSVADRLIHHGKAPLLILQDATREAGREWTEAAAAALAFA
jgi:nucleotide-binding universal stress UspA family protein